jgi:hypothetical protein
MLHGTPSTHTEMQQIIKNETKQDYNLLKNGTLPKNIKELAYGLTSINTPAFRTVPYIDKEF